MERKTKNKIDFFYQILSDMKNNIDTLVKDLHKNQNDLESFAKSLPTVLKSKYPDLKKLGILEKTDKWKITELGKELLQIYEEKDNEKYKELIASIIGTYNYVGFRPYAVLVKFLYLKYGVNKPLQRDEIVKYFSLPISEAIYFMNTQKKPPFHKISRERLVEAPRPYSYTINHLKNAGLVIKENNEFMLSENVEDFINLFFSEIDLRAPKSKIIAKRTTYRVVSRGADQVNFREELLEIYNQRCALTHKIFKINDNNLLEAAHIIPVSHGGSYESTNGILMTPNLHKAFDCGGITFDDQYNIIVHKNVYEENYLPKMKKINYLPKMNHPSLMSIRYHRKYIFGFGVLNSRNSEKVELQR